MTLSEHDIASLHSESVNFYIKQIHMQVLLVDWVQTHPMKILLKYLMWKMVDQNDLHCGQWENQNRN